MIYKICLWISISIVGVFMFVPLVFGAILFLSMVFGGVLDLFDEIGKWLK